MSVYIDTSAFLALMNSADTHYKAAVDAWIRINDDQSLIVASNYVVVETISLLHNRHGLQAVRRFVEDILPVILVEWIDVPIHTAAITRLLTSSRRHGPSLVDCVNLEVMKRISTRRIFAYDQHFEDLGLEIIR